MIARDRLVETACRRNEIAFTYLYPKVRELLRADRPARRETRADRLARELKERQG